MGVGTGSERCFTSPALTCRAILLVLTLAPIYLSGCSKTTSAAKRGEPPPVEVVTVEPEDVPIYGEWIGTLDGMVNASIKAQVTGYLLRQDYQEGSFVREGQLLFEIDPRPFQAALEQARGQLAQANGQLAQANAQLVQAEAQLAVAQANQGRTQLDVDRYTPLAQQQAVAQQDLDNAVQNNLAAKAQVRAATAAVETAKAQIQAATASVEAAHAAVETATLNLGFTRITSPIDGIAGMAQQQVGDLASPSGVPITTVSKLDPIRAYFTMSEQEYLDLLRESSAQGGLAGDLKKVKLDLILADGSTYAQKGEFYFADRAVNVSTGAIRIAGLFPNSGNVLRPGQYGRVRAAVRTEKGAILVPQRAVTELQGSYEVAVVDAGNTVKIRTVQVGNRVGSRWIIRQGVQSGDRVVAEGTQKVHSGMQVTPVPFISTIGTR